LPAGSQARGARARVESLAADAHGTNQERCTAALRGRLGLRATLDIERPFGIIRAKHLEERVTRHDAERKVKILDYIAATLRSRGFPPSVREIARAVGLAST